MSFRLSRPAGFAVAGLTMVGLTAAAAAPSPLYPVYQNLWGFSSFTLTLIFAVYVVALLATLLTMGSLADQLGRRPVLIGGLLVLAVATLIFANAGGVGDLVFARAVQGVATGAITGSVSAMMVDLQPDPHTGSIVVGGAPAFGLALGSALAGGLVQHAPWPRELVFWVLCGAYLLLAIAMCFVPEPARGRPSWRAILRELRPSIGVARPARSTLVNLLPALVATWALGGLYLSLGSSAVARILGDTDHFVVGMVLAAFFLPAALALLVIRAVPETYRRGLGLVMLGGGVAITVVGVLAASTPVYVVGSVFAGVGFGVSFLVAMSALSAVTPATERAQTFATTYLVSYTAFSVPAVLAGLASQDWGLRPTLVGYGVLEIALVILAGWLAVRAARRAAQVPACPQRVSV